MCDAYDEDPPTHFGSAYTLSRQDPDVVGRDFELQRSLLVPKDYQRTKLPIGIIWRDL